MTIEGQAAAYLASIIDAAVGIPRSDRSLAINTFYSSPFL